MSTSPRSGDDQSVPPKSSTVILLLLTIGDTTWRMFVPIIGLMVLGLVADKWLHSTPWLMTLGLTAGILVSVVLIKKQVQKVKQS